MKGTGTHMRHTLGDCMHSPDVQVALLYDLQILYVADISMVITFMELVPGDSGLESGTGSGSLTTALARAVGPTGRVHTFEHHQVAGTLCSRLRASPP